MAMARKKRSSVFWQALFSLSGVILSGVITLATGLYIQRQSDTTPTCYEEWNEAKTTRDAQVLLSYYEKCSRAGALAHNALKALQSLEQEDYRRAKDAGHAELAKYIALWERSALYEPRYLNEAKELLRVAVAHEASPPQQNPQLLPVGQPSPPSAGLETISLETNGIGTWEEPPSWWPSEQRRRHYQRAYHIWLKERQAKQQ